MAMIKINGNDAIYNHNTGWTIELTRYTDPDRLNLADTAATYLCKSDTDNIRRPLSIIRKRDTLAIFRGEFAEFKYHKVPKQVYDHLVTYQTLNMRVAGGNRANISEGYTVPVDKTKDHTRVEYELATAMENYKRLAEEETPQVARAIQPVNAHMPLFKLQWNFQTIIQSLLPQRIWTKGAQGLTRMCVEDMFTLLKAQDSELWMTAEEYYGSHRHEWDKVQTKLRTKEVSVGELIGMLEEWDETANADYALRQLFGQSKSMWGE